MTLRKFLAVAVSLILGTLYRPATAQSGDPTTFTDQLNIERARRGLAPVTFDPGAVPAAAANSQAMAAHNCVGHFELGGMGQCSAYAADARLALAMWAASPAHASLIFAPDLVSVGYSAWGPWATCSTRQEGAAAYPSPIVIYAAPLVYTMPTACVQPRTVWFLPRGGRWRRWR